MIHFEKETTLNWMVGLNTVNRSDGTPAYIKRAVAINRLRMNEFGVRAQSAAYVVVPSAGSDYLSTFVISGPFLLWIERDGLPEPLFAAWLNYDSWKDPKNLA